MENREIAVKLAAHEEQLRTLFKRDETLESDHELLTCIASDISAVRLEVEHTKEILTTRLEYSDKRVERIEGTLKEQDTRIKRLEDTPASNWRTVVNVAIGGIVGALITAAASLLFR